MLKQQLNFKLSQKLSPQQIQLMKLIQLPTQAFEQRIKQELEENPALEGGKEESEDFEDEFLYWINQQTGRMDYMAYTYETEGGGVRFRKAVNPRIINGILLQDYLNYKPEDKNTPLEKMEELYKNGKLELFSEIQLENIEVEVVDN